MNFVIDLDEKGVLLHNTLLLLPNHAHVTILRKLEKGLVGKMLLCTNYNNEECEWKEMVLDEVEVAFRYDFTVHISGAYFFMTCFKPYDEDNIQQKQEGPIIRFVVQNEIKIKNTCIGSSGLCIQTILSSSIRSLSYFEKILIDSYLCGYNCIHITPLQKKGTSGSCYSIMDFLDLDSSFIQDIQPLSYAHSQELQELMNTMKYITEEGKNHYFILASYLSYWKDQLNMLFMTDIVLNHTSTNSPLIQQDLSITFNNSNTPQLIPAIELDLLLQQLSNQLEEEKIKINSQEIIQSILQRIINQLDSIRFKEYWLIGTDIILHELSSSFSIQSQTNHNLCSDDLLYNAFLHCLYEKSKGHRFPLSVDSKQMKEYLQIDCLYQEQLTHVLDCINLQIEKYIYQPFIQHVVSNIQHSIEYRFLHQQIHQIPSISYPLVDFYFTNCSSASSSQKQSISYSSLIQTSQQSSFYCANNGWTYDNSRDPLLLQFHPSYLFRHGFQNTHYSIHTKYLSRDIVVWSDCVKLRYYDEQKQPTFIWYMMKEYIQLSAFLFDGFRLDNCHNTSVDLLQSLLYEGRRINPHLIVLAELFTSNQQVDIDYISRLGLDMIVRETAQSPSTYENVKNYSDLLYQVGGEEFGSLLSITEIPRHFIHTQLPTVLYDMTHDNRSFYELYGLPAIPAVTVLIAMSVTNIASTKGMDEGYPMNPPVTTTQSYTVFNKHLSINTLPSIKQQLLEGDSSSVHLQGNMYLRLLMNHLHINLSQNQYTERFVYHYPHSALISIERRITNSLFSVFSITHTSFTPHSYKDITLSIIGKIVGVFVSVKCEEDCFSPTLPIDDNKQLHGIDFHISLFTDTIHDYCSYEWNENTQETYLHFSTHFTPGSSLVVLLYNGKNESFSHLLNYNESCQILQQTKERVASYPNHPYIICSKIQNLIENDKSISNSDYSYLLFTSKEEQYAWNQWKPYSLHSSSSSILYLLNDYTHTYYQHHNQYGINEFVYCGLYGVIPIIQQLVKYNILTHPLLENLRQGNWLMDYLINRLSTHPSLFPLQQLLAEEFEYIKQCPRNTRPVKFCRFMIVLDSLLKQFFSHRFSLENSHPSLVVATLQFTTRLPTDSITMITAGFPHFATGIMRNWGRDTFIAASGILLQTHRFSEMKEILLDYGSLARHGLICNLYGNRENPRYNSRDATWWWLYCLQLYCKYTTDYSILHETIQMKFYEKNKQSSMTVEECIQWIMEEHGKEINFVEWNAPAIDEHMKEEGFHIQIKVDSTTGLIIGGNESNCGTWMDKMGSYDDSIHSNCGIPATPRIGAAIEITALVASTIQWLDELNKKGKYHYSGIHIKQNNTMEFWNYHDWFKKLSSCFESCYFINHSEYGEYYKDCYNEKEQLTDLQLRPNYIIAMSISPSLFQKQHACKAVQTALHSFFQEKQQLGVKTLSPHDSHYRCFYDNSYGYDGDLEICAGWSYHNGPEWLWLIGSLVEAVITFPPIELKENSFYLKQYCLELLQEQLKYIQEDDWMSLPEMTNHNGEFNNYACRAQAWSIGCCLVAFEKIRSL